MLPSPRSLAVGFAAACSLIACGRATFVVQQYTGPVRPTESIAVLRVNGDQPVRVLELDQTNVSAPLERDTRLHVEMLPGRHSVLVAANEERRAARVAFDAKPGRVYRVTIDGDVRDAHVLEVDRSSDAVVGDATFVEPPPAPAPPPPPAPAPPAEPPPATTEPQP